MREKRNNKESTIYSRPNPSQNKIFEIIGVSLWFPSSPDLNPFDFAAWSVLENKTNATSYPNTGLLKAATEEEWKNIRSIYFESMQIVSKAI